MPLPLHPRPMTHSSAYYESHRPIGTASFGRQSPATSTTQQPPRAHVGHGQHSRSRRSLIAHEQSTRGQGSVSSVTTVSSSISTDKPYPMYISRPYRLSSRAEQGLMQEDQPGNYEIADPVGASTPQTMLDGREEVGADNSAVFRYIQDGAKRDAGNDHAIWILVWLSFLNPIFCLLSATYSIVTILVLLLISPVHLCRKSGSIEDSTIRFLAPLFRRQLQLIYAESVEEAHTFNFNSAMLSLIQAASPVPSVGVMVGAWTAAGFWLFALMMGNPDGTERRDDGRAAVLSVRNWWEKYFLNAIRG